MIISNRPKSPQIYRAIALLFHDKKKDLKIGLSSLGQGMRREVLRTAAIKIPLTWGSSPHYSALLSNFYLIFWQPEDPYSPTSETRARTQTWEETQAWPKDSNNLVSTTVYITWERTPIPKTAKCYNVRWKKSDILKKGKKRIWARSSFRK